MLCGRCVPQASRSRCRIWAPWPGWIQMVWVRCRINFSVNGASKASAVARTRRSVTSGRQRGLRATSAPVRWVLRPVKSSPPCGVRSISGCSSLTRDRRSAFPRAFSRITAPSCSRAATMASVGALASTVVRDMAFLPVSQLKSSTPCELPSAPGSCGKGRGAAPGRGEMAGYREEQSDCASTSVAESRERGEPTDVCSSNSKGCASMARERPKGRQSSPRAPGQSLERDRNRA